MISSFFLLQKISILSYESQSLSSMSQGEVLKKKWSGPDLVSSIARKLAFTTIPGIRPLLLQEFPSEKLGTFDTSEKVHNFIDEVLKFGASHVNRDRIFITGHQGSGKTSLSQSIRLKFIFKI